jgi:hypothetical protein
MTLSNKAIADQAGYTVRAADGAWTWQHKGGARSERFQTAFAAYDDAARHAFDNRRIAIEAYVFKHGDADLLTCEPTATYESLTWNLADLRKRYSDVRVMRRGIVDITHILDGRPLE